MLNLWRLKLRDIWLDMVASQRSFTPVDPLTPQELASKKQEDDPEPATSSTLSPSAISTSFLPNPFASFQPSKSSPTVSSMHRSRRADSTTPADATSKQTAPSSRIDVLPWLARATLDVIGEAGFGYTFHALEAAAERRENENELARAFGVIFGTARKFRVMTVLQVWFPVLRHFVSGAGYRAAGESVLTLSEQKTENATMRQATALTRKIGLELIEQRRAAVESEKSSEKHEAVEGDKGNLDRDLLSVLSTLLSYFCSVSCVNPLRSPLEHVGNSLKADVGERDTVSNLNIPCGRS